MLRISPRSLLRSIFIPGNPRRFLVALSTIGILASKGVHIYEHLLYEPINVEFVLFFPTFFILDIFVLFFIVYCLYRPSIRDLYLAPSEYHDGSVGFLQRVTDTKVFRFIAGCVRITLLLAGILLPFVIYFAASSEVSFYYQSGQQVMWSMTGRVIRDPKSFTGMASEGTHVAIITLIIFWILARVESFFIDRIIGLLPSWARFSDSKKDSGSEYHDVESYYTTDDDSDIEEEKVLAKVNSVTQARKAGIVRKWTWAATIVTILMIIVSFFRPFMKYDGVVTTVPLNMLAALEDPNHKGGNEAYCGGGADTIGAGLLEFPYPELVNWGHHDDGNSDTEWFANWLDEKPPKGFERFAKKNNEEWRKWGKVALHDSRIAGKLSNALSKGKDLLGKGNDVDVLSPPKGYHHAYDPLKLSNLHLDIHPELRSQTPLKNDNPEMETRPLKDVKIRNVILLTMESARSHIFPIRNNTRYVDDVFKYRDSAKNYSDIFALTPTAERLVGKELGKGGSGGIVMNGALTGAEFTLKSLLISHCGMNPLAVDFMEEMAGQQYQACIPQILNLLNANHKKANSSDWRDNDWDHKFVQSVTTSFDRQLNELKMMGFDASRDLITKEIMEKKNMKHPIPIGERTLNYFGYREAVTKPYIRDMIRDAKANNRRLFLSHLTSSTHHPWATPDQHWKKGTFLDDKERNNYLNAVGFVDHWIGEFFDLLEEEKIANETLIVALGDHGLSIGEGGSADSGRVSTFANPHVNNFRIPIVLHHPHLPPVHITANATNLSILPSILDLLLNSDSLPKDSKDSLDRKILSALRPAYEGQSLLRPMVHKTPKGLENYNFAILNPGGTHLTVTSSDPATPYRLVMPLCQKAPYGVTDLRIDSEEENVLHAWTVTELLHNVEKRFGRAAKVWTERGIHTGRWWVREGRRRWDYSGATRKDEREKQKNANKNSKRDLSMDGMFDGVL